MLIKPIAMAAAASLLMTSAAFAGDKADHKTAANADMSATAPTTVNPGWSAATPGWTASPAADQSAASVTTYSSDVAATAPMSTGDGMLAGAAVEIVTNGPIPDTAENRARYGEPLSAAGRRTRPAGN